VHEVQADAAAPGTQHRNLTARAASGLRWSYLASAALVIANLAYTVAISRLLDPVAFGLMALANLVVLFIGFFARMGLASALVQKPELSEEEIRAASTAGIVFGTAGFAVVWVLAPAISGFFGRPELSPVLRVLGLSFPLNGWSMTGLGLLRREFRFRDLSIIVVGTYVLGFLGVGIPLAMLGAGVWSLVLGSLVSTASQALWQYAAVPHPVRPVFRWEPYRAICRYGVTLSGAYLIDYVGSSLDTFTVGRFASTGVVGQYSRAYYLVFQPIRNYITDALVSVTFPSFSLIQSDTARLRRAYLGGVLLSGVVMCPICAGMALAAPEVVLLVLGPQWGLAASVVPWFALAASCSTLSQFSRSLAEARADLKRSLGVQGAYLVALSALLSLALTFRSRGLWTFAAAVACAEILRSLGYLALMRSILALSPTDLWRSFITTAFVTCGVALAIAVVRWALGGEVATLGLFGAEVTVGGVALMACIRMCPLPEVRRELRVRLMAMDALGPVGGLRWRLAPLLLGHATSAITPEAAQ
jgi:O-antigen/teichoic acid export membrane protein